MLYNLFLGEHNLVKACCVGKLRKEHKQSISSSLFSEDSRKEHEQSIFSGEICSPENSSLSIHNSSDKFIIYSSLFSEDSIEKCREKYEKSVLSSLFSEDCIEKYRKEYEKSLCSSLFSNKSYEKYQLTININIKATYFISTILSILHKQIEKYNDNYEIKWKLNNKSNIYITFSNYNYRMIYESSKIILYKHIAYIKNIFPEFGNNWNISFNIDKI